MGGGGVECVSAIIALSYWNSSSVKNVKGPLNYEILHLCHRFEYISLTIVALHYI